MIRYTAGDLLQSDAEALVNTVNTVGVMGKGIALMFKEAFPENFRSYDEACKRQEVRVGKMFTTQRSDMYGPKWIVNFPTKKHWRQPSKLEWIVSGLADLRRFITDNGVTSIALPPLGAGNGGLNWADVRPLVEQALGDLEDVDVLVFEPTSQYRNVSKRAGVEKLTPSRALIAEIVRRYWVLGIECTLLEVQKLAWFVETSALDLGFENPLRLEFSANRYGPYADRLRHLLNNLDGSYLHCDKRIADAGPLDVIWFDDAKRDALEVYFTTPEAKPYRVVLDATTRIIDGFESPLGMELLATVDWLLRHGTSPTADAVLDGIGAWPAGEASAKRKVGLFDRHLVDLALTRLSGQPDLVS